MLYHLLANTLVVVHLAFVGFVVLGSLLVLRWPRVMWAHLPAALWGTIIEFGGFVCPLTPLENYFRQRAGLAEYSTGFIERYLLPLLYPAQLTRGAEIVIGIGVIAINLYVYAWVFPRWKRRKVSSL